MAEAERPQKILKTVSEDRISSLPDDLLIRILSRVPTKDAVVTTTLSKRWRFVWTMLPILEYKDIKNSDTESKSVWWFLDQSMRLYNPAILERLCIQLGPQCPVDVDVVNWVAKAVDCHVRRLFFQLLWKSEPVPLPRSLHTCKTLKELTLSEKIIVDVPCPVSLPLLETLNLLTVVYKDEESHVRLLSGFTILKYLKVVRIYGVDDNVRNFIVKVPSLRSLTYSQKYQEDEDEDEDEEDTDGSLVIDTPTLVYLEITDTMANTCSLKYMPSLVEAFINFKFDLDGNFLRSLSSVKHLFLVLDNSMVPSAVNYPRLTQCDIVLFDTGLCESLVVLLSSCPKLEIFTVNCEPEIDQELDRVPHLWNQPHSVPECLSSHLKIFGLKGYAGREDEKEFTRYILENSKCLKMAGILPNSTLSAEVKHKMTEEIKSMCKVSTEVRLLSDRMWYSDVCTVTNNFVSLTEDFFQ
ncbi:unnamed protein product [Eruca vesicaria subsp. sativa]|uniref:F-box domain-containing protein n=1 Tax=Eruca vesicaria subsp. sativa TaxID=29727 RepID=A0ABC8LKQ6_ERUVS|nr:unnamed protein product [Eruca vesicaria subsp. sativa]